MSKLLRRLGVGIGSLALLAVGLFGLASLGAKARLSQHHETHRIDLPLPTTADAAAVERGRHLVSARYGCAACHGQDLAGGVMLEDPAIGSLRGPNLTGGKGGVTARYTMTDWDRIVRHGVKPDGKPAVMPAEDFFKMSDAELSDIVAFVRSLPPVDASVPPPSFGPVGTVLLALGKLPLSAERQTSAAHASAPPAAQDDAAFGEHLVATCTACHRQDLVGGPMAFGPPSWPAAANLTPHADGLGDWSYEDFERALTLGVSKDGHRLKPPMAEVVQGTRAMTPVERRAIWTFLRRLPPARTSQG